jgi:hypothetical protein
LFNKSDGGRPLNQFTTLGWYVCFSLVSPTSLENIQNIWMPEVKEHSPNNQILSPFFITTDSDVPF